MYFISIDVAFISLTKVLEPVRELLKDDGEVVCLIKPQFEAGRDKVGKKGVVREISVHKDVIEKVIIYAVSLGFMIKNLDYSPIKGPEGNIEYLLHLQKIQKNETDETIEEIRDCNSFWSRHNESELADFIQATVTASHDTLNL